MVMLFVDIQILTMETLVYRKIMALMHSLQNLILIITSFGSIPTVEKIRMSFGKYYLLMRVALLLQVKPPQMNTMFQAITVVKAMSGLLNLILWATCNGSVVMEVKGMMFQMRLLGYREVTRWPA